MTPDVSFPGSGCFLQDRLGFGTVGALDLRGQCSGFLMGLLVADGFVRAGVYERILVAAAEVHSSGLDYGDGGARVARLFGDGAAVALVGPGGDGPELLSVTCHSDGSHYTEFWCESPAGGQHPTRLTLENFREGRPPPVVDFDAVERYGREHLPVVVREVLDREGVGAESVDCFVLSHALGEVVDAAVDTLGVPAAKVVHAGAEHGHLTSASLPVALSEAMSAGSVGKGATVCLATCGAGFTSSAALLRM